MHDLDFVLKSFNKAYLYECEFTTHCGKTAKTQAVAFIRPGRTMLYYISNWNQAARSRYNLIKEIDIADAIELPALPDRLSLKGKFDLVGDSVEILTHDYSITYL